MAIIRKPQHAAVDKVDEFIGEAAVEKTSPPRKKAPMKTAAKDKNKTDSNKRSKKVATPPADFDEMIARPKLFADKFKRKSFYVHKDLAKAVKKMAAEGGKGEKTKIINRALKMYFAAQEKRK